jgi:2-polyprenyl-6-hydroxyphenyl methylase/3-demethylubiquinone-9 3-methyltransferase
MAIAQAAASEFRTPVLTPIPRLTSVLTARLHANSEAYDNPRKQSLTRVNMDQRTNDSVARTIDAAEIARFDVSLEAWWGNEGEARWLHKYNPVRVDYIRTAACSNWNRDPSGLDCLNGLRILDVGCGGGVLCEPLASLGCDMVGADPAPIAIEAARLHARQSRAHVDYRCTTSEWLAAAGEKFDVVLAMEVVEHVADSRLFLESCAALVRPGGLFILSTINRTTKSYAYAILAAERVLRLLPRGTHQWERFVTPEEVTQAIGPSGLRTTDVRGVTMRLLTGQLRLSKDAQVNYIMTAAREPS